MKSSCSEQAASHRFSSNLEHIWKMLTDDEDTCYVSDDRKFYQVLKRKYGIGREEISYMRSLAL